MASAASASCSWPSTGAPARSTWRSRTTRPRPAKAFLQEALGAFPFRVTHLLTDRGSCFTAEGFEKLCRELGIEHRKTRTYTPRTNGPGQGFNGRVLREVAGTPAGGPRGLERLLAGFNQAY